MSETPWPKMEYMQRRVVIFFAYNEDGEEWCATIYGSKFNLTGYGPTIPEAMDALEEVLS